MQLQPGTVLTSHGLPLAEANVCKNNGATGQPGNAKPPTGLAKVKANKPNMSSNRGDCPTGPTGQVKQTGFQHNFQPGAD